MTPIRPILGDEFWPPIWWRVFDNVRHWIWMALLPYVGYYLTPEEMRWHHKLAQRVWGWCGRD